MQAVVAPPWLRAASGGVDLALHVQPGARREGVVGVYGDRLKVAIRSPAVDGRANAALVEWLAAQLQVPRRAIELVGGATSRDKRLRVTGLTAERVAAALGAAADGREPGKPGRVAGKGTPTDVR